MAIRLQLAPRPLAGHQPRRPRRRRQDARHADLAAADPNDGNLNAAGVSRVTGILRAAECNKAPFMYEMKGALSGHGPGSAGFPASRLRVSQLPGLTVPVRLVSQPHRSRSTGRPASLFPVRPVIQTPRPVHPVAQARHPVRPVTRTPQRHAPPAGARHPLQIPVSRPFHRPGETPGMVPVSCGESISTPFARVAQGPTGIHFKFLSCPHLVHRIPPVIRTSQRLSTALCTATPQVTRRNSKNTSA